MLYREAGQFKTSYAADQAVFPIAQDRVFIGIWLLIGFVALPLLSNEYLFRAILIPFLILALAALVLAAADVYDALTSHRPYRSGMPHAEAVAWIAGQSGTHFDPEVVKAFMAVMSESPVRSDQATPLYRPAASLSERP